MQKVIPIKILVVDDHAFYRKGITSIIRECQICREVIEAETGKAALEIIKNSLPDIILLDISLPDMTGFDVIKETYLAGISASRVRFLVVSIHDSFEYYFRAITAGAKGMIHKGATGDLLMKAVTEIYEGGMYFGESMDQKTIQGVINQFNRIGFKGRDPDSISFSKREQEVLFYVLKGLHNKEIAGKLDLSERTIESHRMTLMSKLGVKSLVELLVVVSNSEKLRHVISKSILDFTSEKRSSCDLIL